MRVNKFISVLLPFMLILIVVCIQTPNASAEGEAALRIELDEDEYISIADGLLNDTVKIHGIIYLQPAFLKWNPYDYIHAIIEIDTAGLHYTISHTFFNFTNQNHTYKFTMNVTVPKGTSSSEEFFIILSGEAYHKPDGLKMQIHPGWCYVRVKQYYDFEVNCTDPEKECYQNEQVNYEFNIINKGNGEDNIYFGILNDEELEGLGIAIIISYSSLSIDKNSTLRLVFNVATPTHISSQKIPIHFRFFSRGASNEGSVVEKEYTCYLIIKDEFPYSVIFSIGIALIILISFLSMFAILWKKKYNQSIFKSIRNRIKKK